MWLAIMSPKGLLCQIYIMGWKEGEAQEQGSTHSLPTVPLHVTARRGVFMACVLHPPERRETVHQHICF